MSMLWNKQKVTHLRKMKINFYNHGIYTKTKNEKMDMFQNNTKETQMKKSNNMIYCRLEFQKRALMLKLGI